MTAQYDKSQDIAPRSVEPRRMLTEVQVLDIVPVGRTTLYHMIKTGRFPKGTFISPNRRIWFADEIACWQTSLGTEITHFNPHRRRGGRGHSRISVVPLPPNTS